MEDIELIVIGPGFKKIIPAGTKHRIKYGQEGTFMEISSNGHKDFKSYSVDVNYFCFSGNNVFRGPIPINELD